MDKNVTTNVPTTPEIPASPSEQSTPALIRSFLIDARDLISKELEAAKLEFKTEAEQLKRGVIAIATAGTVTLIGVLLLAISAAYGLAASDALPQWAGFLIVGGGLTLIGGALFLFGRQQVKEVHLPPTQTAKELAEDIEWIKDEGTS